MGMNLAYKILSSKLKDGNLVPGEQIGIQIDQTLTQDSTGTMAYLQLEAMNIKHVAVEKAVAYIDHNMLQTGLKIWMIMNLSAVWLKSMGLFFQNQVMEFVINYN